MRDPGQLPPGRGGRPRVRARLRGEVHGRGGRRRRQGGRGREGGFFFVKKRLTLPWQTKMKSRSIDMRGGGEAGLQAQAGGAPQGSANVKGVKETRFPPKKCLKINIYLKKFVTKTSASASAQRCAALGSARCCRGRSCARTSQGRYGIFLKYFPENKCKKAF